MFEYRNGKLIVDELIFDPALSNGFVVRIEREHFMVHSRPTPDAIKAADIKPYKKSVYEKWHKGTTAWEFFIHGLIPRDGYQVPLGRSATKEEFEAICKEYGLGEDDISNSFEEKIGALYGEEAVKTVISKQVRVKPNQAIGLEETLRDKGIEASNGSPGRVNIRIDFEPVGELIPHL